MNFNHNDDGREDRTFFDLLMSPFRAIKEWVGDAVSGDDSLRTGQGNSFVRLLTLPFRLLWGFLVFMVQAWTTSRDGIAFLRGLPALAILAFTPFLLWVLTNYSRPISLGPTVGYHDMHLRNQAFDKALLFSRKLVALKPESKQYKYLLAEDLDRNGDNYEATRIMQHLAGSTEIKDSMDPAESENSQDTDGNPNGVDEEGETPESETPDSPTSNEPEKYAQAHVWLSQQLIKKQRDEGFDESRNELAMDHLRAAVDLDPKNIRAQVNLIDLYRSRANSMEEGSELQIENLQRAQETLLQLTGYENFFRLEQVLAMPQLIDVCNQLGDKARARRALTDASSKVTRIARLNPEIYQIWYSLVQCAVMMKDYNQANEFIKTGYQNVKTDETRRQIMQLASLVHIQNADDFIDISTEDAFRKRLFALCKAIATNPRDVRTYDRLVEYLDVDTDKERRDVWLRNSILDCPIPGVVHILIGIREMLRGDVLAGKTSWDIAQHQFGTTEFVTHRLLSVAIRKKPEYGETNLLDSALALFPDQYMLYETRGAIKKGKASVLMKQESQNMYEAAIKDFMIVLEKVPDLITVHKHLTDCYEALGNKEKADYHEQKVKELLDLIDEKQRELYERVLNQL